MNSAALRVHRPPQGRASAIDQAPLVGNERYVLERKVLAQVKRTPRFLLRELFDFFQGRADYFPSNAKIAEVSGISPRNVQLVLRQLEKAEIVKSIEDLRVRSQRRIVLLEHPNAVPVMKALNALPQWMARFAEPGGATFAPSNVPRGATTAPQGAQKRAMGGATVAPESHSANPPNSKRVFRAMRGMNPGGDKA
jgi:hypothetical protein